MVVLTQEVVTNNQVTHPLHIQEIYMEHLVEVLHKHHHTKLLVVEEVPVVLAAMVRDKTLTVIHPLAVRVVLVVQLAFSVKVENSIVQNAQEDSALDLAVSRTPTWVAALFRDDRANGEPAGCCLNRSQTSLPPQALPQPSAGLCGLKSIFPEAERRRQPEEYPPLIR